MKQVNLRIYRTILPLLLGLFLSVGAYAQNITVKGNVKDATGEPVIGANVLEKGTTNGVITDLDGNFQLQTSAGATLVVSFVGYLPAEVKAASVLNVVLKEDAQLLDDVVVIGYATGSQRTISGAVQKVGREEMNAGVVVNPAAVIIATIRFIKFFFMSFFITFSPFHSFQRYYQSKVYARRLRIFSVSLCNSALNNA